MEKICVRIEVTKGCNDKQIFLESRVEAPTTVIRKKYYRSINSTGILSTKNQHLNVEINQQKSTSNVEINMCYIIFFLCNFLMSN